MLAGLDQLVHGGKSLHGWGSPAALDPNLLVPRAFDKTTEQFHYDVNLRFAETRPGRIGFQNPFRIVLDFSFDLSTNYDLQQLRRAIEPVRGVRTPVVTTRDRPGTISEFTIAKQSGPTRRTP